MTIKNLGPLDWRTPIVDSGGRPTPEFQRRWGIQVQNNGEIPADFTDLKDVPQSYAAKGGYLVRVKASVDGLEFATVSAAIDSAIGSTRGAVLERGASGWGLVTPGTAGSVWASAGAGADPAYATLSSLLDSVFGSARGNLLYRGASGWQVLAPSTAGNLLQTNGASADPTWVTPSTGFVPMSANVTALESTTATGSFGDLATVGPAVTGTTGTSVIIMLSAYSNKASGAGNTAFMSAAVSGSTTVAANTNNGPRASAPAAGFNFSIAGAFVLTGLTAGSNTFTAKYQVDGSVFQFGNRNITVFRLN